MAEDLLRESGFMLPQSQNVRNLLKSLLKEEQSKDFPMEAVQKLLDLLSK